VYSRHPSETADRDRDDRDQADPLDGYLTRSASATREEGWASV